MPALTIRHLPEELHRALSALAASNGRSIEAEIVAILTAAVNPSSRLKMGEALWELGREIGLTNDDVAAMDVPRDATSSDAGSGAGLHPWEPGA